MLTANPSTILIVDDQPTNLKMLFSFLQESGFKVLMAQSGESAITKLDKVAPDLILLDVMLPGLDGFETCQRLKASAETKDIPVIFMTTLSESLDKIKGLKVGAVDYITKPFQQEEVLARIENQLKLRRLSVQLEAQNQQLQQSQSLLASVLNTSQDGVMVFEAIRDSQGKIIDFKWILANPAAAKMTGRTPQDLLGKQLLVELPGNREAGLFERYVTVVETGIPQEQEFYYDYDGIKAWFVHVAVKLGDGFAVTFRDITDRKQAADALLIAQKRLEYLLSSSPAIIYSCKPDDYSSTFVSENINLVLGYEAQEFLEDASFWVTHIHPDDREGVFAEFPQLFERGQHSDEYRFLHKDGTYRWLLDVIKLVRDEEGNPIECIGSMSDITQRKQVEAKLQESQRWLCAITEANPNILYVHDLIERRNVYINREVYTILGYAPEEVQQMGMAVLPTLMHSEDFAAVPEHFKRLESAKDGEILEFEYRMKHKNGEWRWLFAWETVFTRNTDGKPKQILGTAADISDRKAAELELQTAKTALERQIQRVLLQERITQEIRSSLNPTQVFQTAAIQIGEAFGVNRCLIHTYIDHPTPLIPLVAEYKPPGLVSLLNVEIPVIGNPHVQAMLAQDQAIASDNIYTEPLLKGALPLCEKLSLKSMLAVRTSYQGRPNGAIGLHQYDQFRHWTPEEIDFIESVAAQLGIAIAQANLLQQEKQQRGELALQNYALEKAKLEAESANRAKSHFLSKMSHELRTPLNAILGFTQVMARDQSMTPEHQEYLGIINRSGEHLLQLINDILSMSQIEAGQVKLNQNRFDLYRLLDSLEEMLGLNATSKGLELIFTRTSDVPQYIQTDESKLRQTLINLLGNALKFTQTGRVTLRVGMGERGNNSGMFPLPQFPIAHTRLWFEVEDTGPGIAPEELSRLFDPFVQSETGRQSMEGTGLGLPISQQFVRLMGGEIAVSSTPGQGAIFRFDIQIGLATAADEKPVSSQRRVMGLEPNQPPYRLLIVEDSAVNRKLLVKILEPLGFEVRTATNGQEGVALWESWSPHLIWMDVIMPMMDGYEATQYIKQTPKGQKTVIIALTANAFEEQQQAILKAGCDDFVAKPFQREVLLEKIAHHLRVLYVYEQQETPSVCQPPAPLQAMAPEALTVMPASWVTQLHQAALYADDELMKQLIEQIPLEYDSLRRALRALVDNFRLEQIINLTEPPRP
jgi:two-component system sensor histidine kinase/response regulator